MRADPERAAGGPGRYRSELTAAFELRLPYSPAVITDRLFTSSASSRGESSSSQALWETTLGRASYVLEPAGPTTIPDIQYVADQLLELGVIRKPVKVAEHVRQRNETARR